MGAVGWRGDRGLSGTEGLRVQMGEGVFPRGFLAVMFGLH